jgi:hypothetical protein
VCLGRLCDRCAFTLNRPEETSDDAVETGDYFEARSVCSSLEEAFGTELASVVDVSFIDCLVCAAEPAPISGAEEQLVQTARRRFADE